MAREKKSGDSYNNPFPTNLRTLMNRHPATTQDKLAEITGKTRQTVSQYVNGVSEPGFETLVKIAKYFDVSADWLLGITNDPSLKPNAVDELGLSSEAVSFIMLLKSELPKEHSMLNSVLENGRTASLLWGLSDLLELVRNNQNESSTDGENDVEVSMKLERDLFEKDPSLKGRIHVVTTWMNIQYNMAMLQEDFKALVSEITGWEMPNFRR